jgi:hypothetical protein
MNIIQMQKQTSDQSSSMTTSVQANGNQLTFSASGSIAGYAFDFEGQTYTISTPPSVRTSVFMYLVFTAGAVSLMADEVLADGSDAPFAWQKHPEVQYLGVVFRFDMMPGTSDFSSIDLYQYTMLPTSHPDSMMGLKKAQLKAFKDKVPLAPEVQAKIDEMHKNREIARNKMAPPGRRAETLKRKAARANNG